MKYSVIAVIGAIAALPVGYLIAQSDVREPPSDLKETMVPVDEAKPLTVQGNDRVAVLTLAGTVEDGRTTSLEVTDRKVVATYHPKVRARSDGDWQISVGGEKGFSYQIPNPLTDIEIENLEDGKGPYQALRSSEEGSVTIVIPLNDGDAIFNSNDIEIVELSTKETLLSARKRDEQ